MKLLNLQRDYLDQAILEINMAPRPSPAFMLVSIVSRPSKRGTASLSQFPQCLGLNLLDLLFGHGELLPNLF